MTTHTPNKWRTIFGDQRRTDDAGRTFPANLWVVDGHGTHVATVYTKEAAALIAAAPAMYEALGEVQKALTTQGAAINMKLRDETLPIVIAALAAAAAQQ